MYHHLVHPNVSKLYPHSICIITSACYRLNTPSPNFHKSPNVPITLRLLPTEIRCPSHFTRIRHLQTSKYTRTRCPNPAAARSTMIWLLLTPRSRCSAARSSPYDPRWTCVCFPLCNYVCFPLALTDVCTYIMSVDTLRAWDVNHAFGRGDTLVDLN
jgi:hypothetical protein